MKNLLPKVLVTSVALAGLGLAVAPEVHALNSFTLTGGVSLNPPNGMVAPAEIGVTFLGTPLLSAPSGAFTGLTSAAIQTPLTFTLQTPGFPALYSLPSFDITFTGAGGITTLTVFGPNTPEGDYARIGNDFGSTIANLVTLQAKDNNQLAYTGQFMINDSTGGNSVFSLKFTAVPEPLTMLGASTAIAFGAAFKRRQAKKA